jgi:hypothetical protein
MLPNRENENFGIIFREKGTLNHTKGLLLLTTGINKILLIENGLSNDNRAPNFFFTGGRDGVIKLWKNNFDENVKIT